MERQKESLFTRNFVLIAVMYFLYMLGNSAVTQVIPVHLQVLGAADQLVGLNTTFYTFGALLTRPFGGDIMDRQGRKPVLILSLILVAIMQFLYSIMGVAFGILLLRFFQGLVWGWLSTAFSTVASDNIPREQYGEGISIFNVAPSLGMSLTPLVVFNVYDTSGIRPLSLLAGSLSVVVLLLSTRIQYKTITPPAIDSDTDGQQGVKRQWVEPAALGPALAMFFASLSLGAVFSFITLYGREKGVSNLGIFMTVFSLVGIVLRPVMGKLYDNLGSKLTLFPGMIISILGMVFLAMAEGDAAFVISAIVISAGHIAVSTALMSLAVMRSPVDHVGAANATFHNGMDAGFGAGALIAGGLSSFMGYSGMYLLMTLGPIAGLIISIVNVRRPSAEAKVRVIEEPQEPVGL